jgi:hypothetical protein
MVAPLHTGIGPQAGASAPWPRDIADALATVTLESPQACGAPAETLAAYYAAEALLQQRQALDWLQHALELYGRTLTPPQYQSFLAQALDHGRLACRLLEHALQQACCRPCRCLEQRLDRLRTLVEAME